ncbi:MAG TPA: gluconate 2-dehydrogenase subunit 3 family protein, partial [Bryobacteraceae bacterium]|nr:gluconate 2-dehydrogenase subunit 3 family protein [Bryobacteraceae bacterium]
MKSERREFLTIPAKTLGGFLLYTLSREPFVLEAAEQEVKVPLRFFTEAEAKVVAAACERIFPSDESGPGAREAGVIIYIDRQLAGPYGRDKYRYTRGPWIESVPEHGYQGKATPRQIYREGIKRLGDFVSLTPEQQDEKLAGIERTMFFQMLRSHTIEGMFCDPLHGGNAGMIGWQLI